MFTVYITYGVKDNKNHNQFTEIINNNNNNQRYPLKDLEIFLSFSTDLSESVNSNCQKTKGCGIV